MAYRLILGLALFLIGAPANADITGPARVIDGDTIEIAGERIRLHGIDAPEAKQTCQDDYDKEWDCGQEATFALAKMVGNLTVTCKGNQRDKYGRLIAVCFVGNQNLNAELVRQGWALAYRRYSMDYVDDEKAARVALKGLWNGVFVPPWEWRRGKR